MNHTVMLRTEQHSVLLIKPLRGQYREHEQSIALQNCRLGEFLGLALTLAGHSLNLGSEELFIPS